MNVTESLLRLYLEKFHSTLKSAATQYLPPEEVTKLFHLSYQDAGIRGYVSTQFGAGFEYVPSVSGIEVRVGNRRVEDLFLDWPASFQRQFAHFSPLVKLCDGSARTVFSGITISSPFPFYLDAVNADITLINCHFEYAAGGPLMMGSLETIQERLRQSRQQSGESGNGWFRDALAAQLYGNGSASFWSLEQAVARAKDEVLAAVVDVNKAKAYKVSLADYVHTRKNRSVLVLGDDSKAGMRRLQAICRCLVELRYVPTLLKDVPDFFDSDLQQQVSILGAAARFILVDHSPQYGHLVEIEIAQQNRWVTVLLHSGGQRGSFTSAALSAGNKVFSEQVYDPEMPCPGIRAAAQWAESQLGRPEQGYSHVFPWRGMAR